MPQMEINDILSLLPHRYPFVLVDRVLEYDAGKTIKAIKNVTINEPYFTGHFPDMPVMPGVLMVEALAQASILLLAHAYPPEQRQNQVYLFAGIDNVRFKHVVVPGDQLLLEVTIIKNKRDITKAYGEASVAGKLACCADLMSIRKDKNA